MVYSKAVALELIALLDISYQVALGASGEMPPGYDHPQLITADPEAECDLLKLDRMPIWGYLTTDHTGAVIVVFRGTQDIEEWAEDFMALPMAEFLGYHVHPGFLDVYQAIRDDLVKVLAGRTPLFTGHSLGAALATIAWLEFGGRLMTFASPRVADAAGATKLWNGETVRVVNALDVVPETPPDAWPIWPYRHGGREVKVFGMGSPLDKKLAHSLDSYRIGIEKSA